MKDLRGKNAVLTGASRGLGPYIARALAQEGVNVALTARTADALEATVQEVSALGVEAVAIPMDITDEAGRKRLLERARAAHGPIDILINNAGIEWICRYTDMSSEQIEHMVQTNLIAPLILSRLVLPDMIERGSGHIVMMSSLGGKKGSPYSATYAATKAGLIEWTSSVREELRGSGVSASVLCPGFVSDAGMFAGYGKRAPRLAGETSPEKVAAAVVHMIEHDIAEKIINPGPKRLLDITNAISPTMVSWILRRFGVYEFYRQQAEDNQQNRPT
ncbi:MAG: SDR family NAD(P)-dependent oxidoreductase [Deltaproteobacteria bacterium]|nr:SDR family NAD(P)-dependent oxidoreductase [Deltaproteobacteria bacterium]